MEKSTLILLNVFLVLFWFLMALFSPSYITKIQNQPMTFHNVELKHHRGRGWRDGIVYIKDGKKYFSSCRNMEDDQGHNFCDYSVPATVLRLQANLILEGTYHNSENIVIIKSVEWQEKDQGEKFIVSQKEYMKGFLYVRNEYYLTRFCLALSFFVLNLYYLFKRRKLNSKSDS